MKAYSMIELAEDIGISERTAWRWLKQGKIKKRSEDGRIIFVLVDEPTDSDTDDTDNVTTDVSDMSENDTEPISDVSSRRGRKLGVPIPSNKAIPVQNPSPELKGIRESVEIKELLIRGAAADKKLSTESPELTRKREYVTGLKYDAEAIEARKVIEERTREERKEERKVRMRERIEGVKKSIIPEILKKQIPVNILLTTYDALSRGLNELPDSTSDDDLILYANLILSHVWNWNDIYSSIRNAKLRMIFDGIYSMLEAGRQSYNAQHSNIFPTLESFVNFWLPQLPVKQSVAIVQGIDELSRLAGIKT